MSPFGEINCEEAFTLTHHGEEVTNGERLLIRRQLLKEMAQYVDSSLIETPAFIRKNGFNPDSALRKHDTLRSQLTESVSVYVLKLTYVDLFVNEEAGTGLFCYTAYSHDVFVFLPHMHKVLKGFSEKKDGSMYLSLANPMPENIEHRKQFLAGQGIGGKQVAMAGLVHGTRVAVVRRNSSSVFLETDALVTKDADSILTLTGADCFPLYFEEKTAGIIGLAHGGWRGIVGGIVAETMKEIAKLGGKPEKTVLTIGPGICTKHFEIQTDVLEQFAEYQEYVVSDAGLSVDLKGIVCLQAKKAGLPAEQIIVSQECTFCLSEKYFSYRRDQPQYMENQLAYIVQFSHRKF